MKSLLFKYGAFLIVVGILGYLSNPEKAKTALMSGGTFGIASFVLGYLWTKKPKLSKWASLAMLTMLVGVFTWRSSVSWMAVMGGHSEKLIAAILISSMFLASLFTGVKVLKASTDS